MPEPVSDEFELSLVEFEVPDFEVPDFEVPDFEVSEFDVESSAPLSVVVVLSSVCLLYTSPSPRD